MNDRLARSSFVSLALAACMLAACAPEPARAATLPGAEPYPPELAQRLGKALAAEGQGYVPRTRHLLADGGPRFVNRLMLETSPYLRQHAHNPVNWYPWGDEAFEAAARLGRPVLLSIGYSTCHWCHVMEEESFEDEEIAAYLNANYVAIKVDREERPDLDAIYMQAVQTLTGRGGWPMTTWLTTDRRPFYGGTYFPARDGDRGARTGFLTLLKKMREAYDGDRDRVADMARQLAERVERAMQPVPGDSMPTAASLDLALKAYVGSFDATHGGRGGAPKFPSSMPVRFLLREHLRGGNARPLEMARLTLKKMADGGMYDQAGGGFHRYSVDAAWQVPHFEKMLYDNALLAVSYLEAYQLTRDEEFARIAREILDYVLREMTAPRGGFYSATDADSLTPEGHREEGWYFTWTPDEIRGALGPEDATLVIEHYGVTPRGNFEGRSILHVARDVEELAAARKLEHGEVRRRIDRARAKLREVRASRPAPLLDDKILASWNGLMISAMARGGFVLDEPRFTEAARAAGGFVLEEMRKDGRLLRSFNAGRARHRGYLDDYAFVTAGMLDLYEATWEKRWLTEAIALQRALETSYADPRAGGYFMTASDHETLLAREKPSSDGAEPSGNSVALMNLLRLHEWTTDDRYRAAADALLRAFSPTLQRAPTALPEMLLGLEFRLERAHEVLIVTPGPPDSAAPFVSVLRRKFVPNKVATVLSERDVVAQAEVIPWLEGKRALRGKTTAYVCRAGVCKLPTSDAATFENQLEATKNTEKQGVSASSASAEPAP